MKKQILFSLMALMILTALISCGGVVLEPNQLSNGSPFNSETNWALPSGDTAYFSVTFNLDNSYQARLLVSGPGVPPEVAVMDGTYTTEEGTLTLTCSEITDGADKDSGAAILKALEDVPLPLDGESAEFQVDTGNSLGGGTLLTLTDSDGTEHVYRGGPLE